MSFRTSAAICMIAVPVTPVYGQTEPTGNVFELHELAAGVYAGMVLSNPSAYAFANSLIVIGDDGVLVVDTQQSLTAARALIARIGSLTDLPVRWVVNTHWHGDHVNGNQVYAAAYDGVQFIAHASLPDDLRDLYAARRAAELAELPASIAQRRQWLRDGRTASSATLTAADSAAILRSVALREAYNAELAHIAPTLPTITFADRLELDVGGHRVELLHAGPAHTTGDVIVVLPQLGIAAVGDLVEAGMPYFGDAYPAGWLRALDRIAAQRPAILLPAHGPVLRDNALLDDTRALLGLIVHADTTADDYGTAAAAGSVTSRIAALWAERYGVSATAFNASLETARVRARLERESARAGVERERARGRLERGSK